MRSTSPPSSSAARDQDVGDLTTKARIRDAALSRFPRDGFAATTIRAIAHDAGVSPGLVVHHFGSKDGLRQACDRYVVGKFRETKLAAMEEENVTNPGFAATAFQVSGPLLRYFGWALVRGHSAADELFDEMVREGLEITRTAVDKGMVKDSADIETRTTVQMALMLGMTALHSHVERNTGVDPLTPEGMARLTPSLLEIFSGLFDEDFLARIAETYRAGAEAIVPA
ncbi:MAG TPA: TetR/AcrR family transcriptional regulator [Acidimicrobiia bacterium]|nr:TetR/AcrR family transcriptional regulator [Acidimicrobiia bacterium]